jgi:hypothetical protein
MRVYLHGGNSTSVTLQKQLRAAFMLLLRKLLLYQTVKTRMNRSSSSSSSRAYRKKMTMQMTLWPQTLQETVMTTVKAMTTMTTRIMMQQKMQL